MAVILLQFSQKVAHKNAVSPAVQVVKVLAVSYLFGDGEWTKIPAKMTPCLSLRRTTRKGRDRHGLHQPGHADRRKGAERDGALLRHIPKVLEEVSLFSIRFKVDSLR